MRIFGFEITRARKKAMESAHAHSGGTWYRIFDWVTGAWQQDSAYAADSIDNVLAFSAVYSSVQIIAGDVAKLPLSVRRRGQNDVWPAAPGFPVLRKPNRYQTRLQFVSNWVTSRLLAGNTYVLKERDRRGQVVALYVLDPRRVEPLVADDGAVFYRLQSDNLSGTRETVIVPAREIIHDRAVCLFHPLIGVSPIFACAWPATMGSAIQRNSARFFKNMSRPPGILTAPGSISDATATRLKEQWQENYSGENTGKTAVLGDGLKYEPLTMSSIDAQLIEQLRWSVEDVARCFRVPLYMLAAGAQPTFNNIGALLQMYLGQTLQEIIESIELLLDDGLELGEDHRTEFDTTELLRMDVATRYDAIGKAVGAGWMSPNEARASEGLPPVVGGETPYLQAQNVALSALAQRDADEGFAPPNLEQDVERELRALEALEYRATH